MFTASALNQLNFTAKEKGTKWKLLDDLSSDEQSGNEDQAEEEESQSQSERMVSSV
jgi:hypothetical protein